MYSSLNYNLEQLNIMAGWYCYRAGSTLVAGGGNCPSQLSCFGKSNSKIYIWKAVAGRWKPDVRVQVNVARDEAPRTVWCKEPREDTWVGNTAISPCCHSLPAVGRSPSFYWSWLQTKAADGFLHVWGSNLDEQKYRTAAELLWRGCFVWGTD